MSDDQLEKLKMVLEIAERNGNQLFAENILKEIKAIESGEISPIVKDYAADQMDQQE